MLADRRYCYPLTITDFASRYLIACEALRPPRKPMPSLFSRVSSRSSVCPTPSAPQYVCLEEEWTRGYLQEIQDFMECAATGRQPLSDLALAYETTRVNYASYWAAEEGRRVTL